jgi:hypothetical protein
MGTIFANGVHQSDLYTMLKALMDNFNDMCTELTTDTSGTYTGTAYDVKLNMNNIVVDSTGSGLGQAVVYAFLKDLIDKYNTLMAALDTTDLTATTYASGLSITDNFDDDTKDREIQGDGMFQGDLVYTLNHIITQWNLLQAQLDADGLCAGYVTAYGITDSVDTTGA